MILPLAALLLVNKRISQDLKTLSQKKQYSKIEIILESDCKHPDLYQECSLDSCKSENFKMTTDGTYSIDLLKVPEVNTNYKEGASEIWNKLEAVTDASLYQKLLSGVHFSVSTHISAFYKRVYFRYRTNYSYYKRMCIEKYKKKFVFAYQFMLAALTRLNNERLSIRSNEFNVSRKGSAFRLTEEIFLIQKKLKECNLYEYTFPEFKKELVKKVRKMSLYSKPDTSQNEPGDGDEGQRTHFHLSKILDSFDAALSIIPCMNCQRCHLWSKIQFIGLKAATKLLFTPEKLSKEEIICFVNTLNLFSESMNKSEKIEAKLAMAENALTAIMYYKSDIVVCLFTFFMILYFYFRFRRIGENDNNNKK